MSPVSHLFFLSLASIVFDLLPEAFVCSLCIPVNDTHSKQPIDRTHRLLFHPCSRSSSPFIQIVSLVRCFLGRSDKTQRGDINSHTYFVSKQIREREEEHLTFSRFGLFFCHHPIYFIACRSFSHSAGSRVRRRRRVKTKSLNIY